MSMVAGGGDGKLEVYRIPVRPGFAFQSRFRSELAQFRPEFIRV